MHLLVAIGLLFSAGASASYRVHELKLTYYDSKGKPVRERVVQSTLDHLQYEHYHGGYRTVRAELLDTWYCPGDTSRSGYCPRPVAEVPTRGPASTEPKRRGLGPGRQPVRP